MPYFRRRRTTVRRRPMMGPRRPRHGYRKTRGYRRVKRYDNRLTNRIQPNISYVTMKYSTTIQLDAGSGSINAYLFKTNSIYDPDHSGTGHQPSLHDLYQSLYQHYEVLRSKCIIRPLPVPQLGEVNAGQRLCTVALTTVQSTADTAMDIEEIREFNRGPVMFVNDNSLVYGRGSTISKTWTKRNWYGRESPQETASGFGSDPNAMAYFKIQQSAVGSGLDPIALNIAVDIYYHVKLTRPITQSQS